MILTAFHGFCMALADSVPGVSGGTIAFIPFIAAAERTALKRLRSAPFALLGMAVVVGLTLLRGSSALGSVSFASLSPFSMLYIFLSGAVAITAMVLPGISGSSILLISGVYLPAIQAVRSFLHMELSVLPGLFARGAVHSCHPHRAAQIPQRDGLAHFRADARFALSHRVWSGQPDRRTDEHRPPRAPAGWTAACGCSSLTPQTIRSHRVIPCPRSSARRF